MPLQAPAQSKGEASRDALLTPALMENLVMDEKNKNADFLVSSTEHVPEESMVVHEVMNSLDDRDRAAIRSIINLRESKNESQLQEEDVLPFLQNVKSDAIRPSTLEQEYLRKVMNEIEVNRVVTRFLNYSKNGQAAGSSVNLPDLQNLLSRTHNWDRASVESAFDTFIGIDLKENLSRSAGVSALEKARENYLAQKDWFLEQVFDKRETFVTNIELLADMLPEGVTEISGVSPDKEVSKVATIAEEVAYRIDVALQPGAAKALTQTGLNAKFRIQTGDSYLYASDVFTIESAAGYDRDQEAILVFVPTGLNEFQAKLVVRDPQGRWGRGKEAEKTTRDEAFDYLMKNHHTDVEDAEPLILLKS